QVDKGVVRIDTQNLSQKQLFALLAPAFDLNFGTDGVVGRNSFRSPGVASLDFTIIKNFSITERQKIIFRTEFFNLFNRVHFGTPVRVVEAPAFGRSVSTTVPARMIQFAVKYSF
ncbi:MAG: hypothetical protein JNN15_10730, partial [Blastocatellia bacterium]|nr:hypothetical protein [Blastocatellia bacterium]